MSHSLKNLTLIQTISYHSPGNLSQLIFRRGICEAIIPLLEYPDRKLLYKSGLMVPDVRTREGTWKTGAGTMKISGRRTKKWRKR